MPGKKVSQRREKVRHLHSGGLNNLEISLQLDVSDSTIGDDLKSMGLVANGPRKGKFDIKGDMGKCSKCEEWHPLQQYAQQRKNGKYPYRTRICHSCRYKRNVEYSNEKPERFLRRRFCMLRRHSRQRKKPIDFDLTYEWVLDTIEKQNWKCFYTDVGLIGYIGSGFVSNSISFDRVRFDKGYVKENVVICSKRINTVKSDLTIDEIRSWMPPFYERLKKAGFVE